MSERSANKVPKIVGVFNREVNLWGKARIGSITTLVVWPGGHRQLWLSFFSPSRSTFRSAFSRALCNQVAQSKCCPSSLPLSPRRLQRQFDVCAP